MLSTTDRKIVLGNSFKSRVAKPGCSGGATACYIVAGESDSRFYLSSTRSGLILHFCGFERLWRDILGPLKAPQVVHKLSYLEAFGCAFWLSVSPSKRRMESLREAQHKHRLCWLMLAAAVGFARVWNADLQQHQVLSMTFSYAKAPK